MDKLSESVKQTLQDACQLVLELIVKEELTVPSFCKKYNIPIEVMDNIWHENDQYSVASLAQIAECLGYKLTFKLYK